jgi:hypothetical protein
VLRSRRDSLESERTFALKLLFQIEVTPLLGSYEAIYHLAAEVMFIFQTVVIQIERD